MPKYYQNYNKKSLEIISKSNYVREFVLPHCQKSERDDDCKVLKSATGPKNQQFYYIDQQQVQSQSPVTPALLLNSFVNIYPTNISSKLDSHSFVNTVQVNRNSLLNRPIQFQQVIDIVIVERGSSQGSQSQTSRRTYVKISSETTLQRSDKSVKESRDFQVYIVHFLYATEEIQSVKWDTFVQKYVFRNLNDQQSQLSTKITYSMLFSYTNSTVRSYSFLNFVSLNNSTMEFLHSYFDAQKGNEQRLKKLQSYLFHLSQLKNEIQDQDSQNSKLPCYCLELKRQRKVPAEHFMEYKKLKDKMLKSYKAVNQEFIDQGCIKDVDMKVENMVCRFLIEHDYNFEKTHKELLDFMKFENDLRKNFTMSHFQHWVDQDIIGRIGQDRMGRPVILFKTYNFLADKCNDVTDYVNYLFYFILIDTMSMCRGYVDELIMLADCSNNTMKNLKVEVNRRMVPTGLKYCPRMFFKLMPFKCTAVPYYAYTLAKPLLPSYSNEVILMVKEGDQKIAFNECLKWMDIEVIPQVIGGKNKSIKNTSEKNFSTRDD